MTSNFRLLVLITAVCVCNSVITVRAQPLTGLLNPWTNAGSGNWANAGNWGGSNIPDGQGALGLGDDFAIIDNGGEAIVSSAVTQPSAIPGGIGVGSLDSTTGTLTVANGGVLEVLGLSGFPSDGSVRIGRLASGLGLLNVTGNGTLIAESLTTGGAAGSSIHLQDSATVTLSGLASLARTTRINGPNVNFLTTGNLQLGQQSNLVAEITGSSHSPLAAMGNATVGGILTVDFGGFSPSGGDSWTIIDASNISGGFSAVDLVSESLGPGQRLATRLRTTGTTNGAALDLFVSQVLVMTIDRNSGEVLIENLGSTAIDIDSYAVRSALGDLTQVGWQQLGSGWEAANPSSTLISELNQSSMSSIAAMSSLSLGPLFSPSSPTAFGDPTEDIVFEYGEPGEEAAVEGMVQYQGVASINNLVLQIDPTTGQGRLVNPSAFDVSMDGYSIDSSSGSLKQNLLTNNDADWDSLEDQGLLGGGWEEANADQFRLSELKQSGEGAFNSGNSVGLGGLFDISGGSQDLTFEFLLAGESTSRQGVVIYEALTPGDFDSDGDVDGFDFLQWQLGGSPNPLSSSDLAVWESNFGNPASSAALQNTAAVPEPQSFILALFAVGLLLTIRTHAVKQ